MTHDQADELRQLARQSAASTTAKGPPPRLIVVSGGKGGVGTTTVAVNLAAALARQGRGTVLVDADLDHASAGLLCQVPECGSVVDILQGRRTIHELLGRGPLGLQVLAGDWAPGEVTDASVNGQQRLMTELAALGPHCELVVIDVGSGRDHFARRFWEAADLVVLVTTSEPASIMDSYAAIKVLLGGETSVPIQVIVNLAPSAAVAADTQARINHACRRFLGVATAALGHLPAEPCVREAALAGRPFVVSSPRCEASRALDRVAEVVSAAKRPARGGEPTARWRTTKEVASTIPTAAGGNSFARFTTPA